MTNKKIWLTILAVMLIVCMLCSFVGCKNNDEQKTTTTTPNKTTKTDGEKAVEQLLSGIENAINEQNLQDLKAGANIDFEVKYGTETKKYNLAFNLDLDLVQRGETSPSHNTQLEAEITDMATNKVVLGVYYYDGEAGTNDVYTGNSVYLRTEDKLMYFDAPFIADTMTALAADVQFTDNADISDAMSSADSIVGILKDYLGNATYSETGSSVSIKLGDIVDGLKDLISGINISDYTNPLNVDITLDQVIEAIKSLTITINTTVDNGVLTGVDLSLGLDAFDLTAKKLNSTENLLVVKLDKNTTVSISADFKVGDFITHTFNTGDLESAEYTENLINAQASLDFYVSNPINIMFNESLGLSLNAGYYTVELKAAANPFLVLSKLKKDGKWDIAFVDTYTVVTDPVETDLNKYFTKPDATKEEYVQATTFNASTTYYTKTAQLTNIIDAVSKIVPIIADLQLKLTQTKDVNGNAVSIDAGTATYLDAEIVKNYSNEAKEAELGSYVYLKMNLLSGLSLDLSNGMSLTDLLEQVPGLIEGLSSADDGLDDATKNTLTTIGGYLLGSYLGINDGETGHGLIYASFDSSKTTTKKIPFSGYTAFNGEYNDAYTYYVDQYTVVAASAAKADAFNTYYIKNSDDTYTKADSVENAKFDAATTYYTHAYVGAGNITAFAAGTQYYVGPEYGIGLNATLNTANLSTAITSTSGLITATIDGLDFIKGMPASLTVSIGNVHASLFDFTPNYAVNGEIQSTTAA